MLHIVLCKPIVYYKEQWKKYCYAVINCDYNEYQNIMCINNKILQTKYTQTKQTSCQQWYYSVIHLNKTNYGAWGQPAIRKITRLMKTHMIIKKSYLYIELISLALLK